MRFIGITGGVGSGKTALLDYIGKHYKCEIYRADEVAHLLEQPGQECWRWLIDLLGDDILLPNQTIDRRKMADKIFANPSLRRQVNGIVHPAVEEYMMERVREARLKPDVELLFLEAALLIETGYKEKVDELWYIYVREEIRRQRLAQSRGYSEQKMDLIIGSQLPASIYIKECDVAIDNNGEPEEMFRQIDGLLEGYTWLD